MSHTVLEVVQEILSSLSSDEVNSISDTIESNQIAMLLKRTYYDILTDLDLPEHNSLVELTASGSSSLPTLMYIPEKVKNIHWVKYNIKTATETYANYKTLQYCDLLTFQDRINEYRNRTTSVGTMNVPNNSETFEFMYITNKHPEIYTVIDDNVMLFDSYDSSVDTTLQNSKTMCYCSTYPTFVLSDATIIDLNENQMSLLRNRAIERASIEINQTENPDARREARRQRVISYKQKRKAEQVPEQYRVPRYGR